MPGTRSGSTDTAGSAASSEERQRRSGVERGSDLLVAWLDARIEPLSEQWRDELRARDLGAPGDHEPLLRLFSQRLLRFLPLLVGHYRVPVESIWDRGFQLYGTVAAKRGLAAGEAVEELQVLRELMIRELHRDAVLLGRLPLRELLLLNRALDRAVTHASIGHVDALFFAFLEDGGATPHAVGDDLIDETRAQLLSIHEDVQAILERLVGDDAPSLLEN